MLVGRRFGRRTIGHEPEPNSMRGRPSAAVRGQAWLRAPRDDGADRRTAAARLPIGGAGLAKVWRLRRHFSRTARCWTYRELATARTRYARLGALEQGVGQGDVVPCRCRTGPNTGDTWLGITAHRRRRFVLNTNLRPVLAPALHHTSLRPGTSIRRSQCMVDAVCDALRI